jgi:hypothetical protein
MVIAITIVIGLLQKHLRRSWGIFPFPQKESDVHTGLIWRLLPSTAHSSHKVLKKSYYDDDRKDCEQEQDDD